MITFYRFPEQSVFGRVLPKTKIYQYASPPSKVKSLFTQEVAKIQWVYKFSPETLHIPATEKIKEIQVFHILLKTGKLSDAVLETIDRAIPSPIYYLLRYEGKSRYVAAWKRPNIADKKKWMLSEYFKGEWVDDRTVQPESLKALPVTLNLEALYEILMCDLIPLKKRDEEAMDDLMVRVDKVNTTEREMKLLWSRLQKEKQFNRKVTLNAEHMRLKQQLDALKR